MNSKDFLKEGFVEDAHMMHQDHEVQMAREECYHAAENAIALHKLLRNISEQQGLDGWVSAKITLAGDYLKTVREYIEYELMTAASQQPMLPIAEGSGSKEKQKTPYRDINSPEYRKAAEKQKEKMDKEKAAEPGKKLLGKIKKQEVEEEANDYFKRRKDEEDRIAGTKAPAKRTPQQTDYAKRRAQEKKTEQGVAEGILDRPGEQDSAVAQAIIRRILLQRTDLLAKHGPEKVGAAVDEVADFVGDVDEIGSSDVSGWVRHVEQMLGNMQQGMAEGGPFSYGKPPRKGSVADLAAKRRKEQDRETPPIEPKDQKVGNAKVTKDVKEGHADQQRKIFKKNGKPVGEVGIDRESSPGVGQYYMKHYASGKDLAGYDSYEEAVAELKHFMKQGVAEGSSCNMTMEGKSCPMHGLKKCPGYKSNIEETTAGSVAGVVNPTPKNKAKVGTLFGGTYKQKKAKA